MKPLADYPFDDFENYGVAPEFEGRKRFSLILNNTAALHRHRHFGPNHVMRRLCQGLVDINLPPLLYANDQAGLDLVLSVLEQPPTLVVLNGEGTMHDDQRRAVMLLRMAQDLSARGIPTVLINTIWQNNSAETATMLANIDLIAARENQSHQALLKIRPDTLLVPDLLLSAQMGFVKIQGEGIGVVDCSARSKSLDLMRFAAAQGHRFYAMERRLLDKPDLIRNTGLNPDAITMPQLEDISNHNAWVVGRFHFAMALMVHGIPFAALPTRVHKMQAMLHDAGLMGCLLPDDWQSLTIKEQQLAVQTALGSWNSATLKRAQTYVKAAERSTNAMFACLVALQPSD